MKPLQPLCFLSALLHLSLAMDLGVLEKLKHLNDDLPAASVDSSPAAQAFDRGNTLRSEERFMEAADEFYTAMTLRYSPLETVYMAYLDCYQRMNKLASGYFRVGSAYIQQGDQENAVNLLLRTIDPEVFSEESRDDIAEAYHLLSTVYSDKDMKKTLEFIAKAISLRSDKAEYHYELGTYLFAVQEWSLALESFRTCYNLDPELGAVLANVVYLETRICEWDKFDEHMALLETQATKILNLLEKALEEAGEDKRFEVFYAFSRQLTVEPHMTLAFPLDPALKLRIAKRQALFEQVKALRELGMKKPYSHSPTERVAARRIRVGYVSADFKLKATSYLLRHFFQFHNRDLFEVFCFATTADSDDQAKAGVGGSDWREDIASTVEHFMDISVLSPKDRIKMIHKKLKIDILINMDGYSNNGIRDTYIFQVQAAPIQMSMIVYVGSLGASYVQYVITDKVTSPVEYEQYYSEKFVQLPQSFFANVHAITREISPPRRERVERDSFVFCNFNKHLKISPSIFKLWLDVFVEVIAAQKQVKFLLLEFPKDSMPNLKDFIAKEQPALAESEYFSFEAIPFVSSPYVHQERIGNLCDVVLDNPIYNAHTMAVDTLWAGVPLLTFGNGVDMGGRVGFSILSELGLWDMVANSTEEYKDIAVALGTNKEFYMDVRSRLVESCYEPLNRFWNPRLYMHHLEKGLFNAWSRFLEGKEPEHIAVESSDPKLDHEFSLPKNEAESCAED